MLLLVNWSFDRGFLQYVNKVEQAAHNNLISELAEIYGKDGDWESLRDNKRLWQELHISSFMKVPQVKERLGEIGVNVDEKRIETFRKKRERKALFERHRDRSGFSRHGRGPKPRSTLLDLDKRPIVGRAQSLTELKLLDIEVDGKTIGYLGIPPRKKLADTHDLHFSEQIGRSFILIALLAIVISVIVSLPLSRQLVKPVKSLTKATEKLTAGDYSTRIEVSSSDELGKLSNDFNTLARTLEQNEKTRQQWIADISHELRTPLAVLRGEVEALQDGVRQPTQERLNSLHNEVMNLNRLIEDLYELSMSDIGALSYRKQEVELSELIDSSVNMFHEEFEQKGVSLEFSRADVETLTVFADPDRLRQLFSNLLTNSLRYTDAGGKLEIVLGRDSGKAIIQFADSTPGVSTEDLPKLFERLYRVDNSRSRSTGGAGLGLSICKNIVEAHDGVIVAEKSTLGGLIIKIELPEAANL